MRCVALLLAWQRRIDALEDALIKDGKITREKIDAERVQAGGEAMHIRLHSLFEIVACAVDKMSVGKAICLRCGSGVSLASVVAAPELAAINEYLKSGTVAIGLATGVMAFVLVSLKACFEAIRVWMLWRHRNKPPNF